MHVDHYITYLFSSPVGACMQPSSHYLFLFAHNTSRFHCMGLAVLVLVVLWSAATLQSTQISI